MNFRNHPMVVKVKQGKGSSSLVLQHRGPSRKSGGMKGQCTENVNPSQKSKGIVNFRPAQGCSCVQPVHRKRKTISARGYAPGINARAPGA
jgi:hypothetical protein